MNKNRLQHAMKTALILGVYLFISLFLMVFSIMKMQALTLLWLISAAFTPYIVYILQRKFRNEQGGFITYRVALNYGVLLFFFSSFILSFGAFVYLQFINTHFFVDFIQFYVRFAQQNNGVSSELIDQLLALPTPSNMEIVFQLFMSNMMIGIFLSLITSTFVKKQNL